LFLRDADAVLDVPFEAVEAAVWESDAELKSPWLLLSAWQ
jgi:hypothetical protein